MATLHRVQTLQCDATRSASGPDSDFTERHYAVADARIYPAHKRLKKVENHACAVALHATALVRT
jgi:hypothetical protein